MLADYSDTDKRDFSPLEEKIGALLNDEDDIAKCNMIIMIDLPTYLNRQERERLCCEV